MNTIFHQRNLASPNDPGVIKPNVDTLYSRVVLDLSQNDVVLTIPPVNETTRYFNYPVIDLFGNIIAEIGSVNGNQPGKYLIRRADDYEVAPGYVSSNTTQSLNSTYRGVVNLPTSYGTMLIRYLLFSNTTADLDKIHAYQNASSLTNITRAAGAANFTTPTLISLAPNGTFSGIDSPDKLLNLSAKLVPYNQPENYTDRYRVDTTLARAGVYNGYYTAQTGINLTLAAAIANATITNDTNNPANIRQQGNDWELSTVAYQGNFGTNYGARAYVAIAGYQQQTVRQTLYPGYKSLGFTSQASLAPNTSLLLTFSGKPKLKTTGFWSYTVYGADQYLIVNPLNRFEQGDRSYNLTYQDGSGPVYGPNANASHDGPFQVLVQNVNNTPPANWTGNWIPGANTFSFITRWYVPEDAMTNGSYVYPKVQQIPAITA